MKKKWICDSWKVPESLKRVLMLMKIIIFIIMVSFSTISANSFSQTKLSLNLQNVQLSQVLEEISKKSDYEFLYNDDEINTMGRVSVNVVDVRIKKILDICLKKKGIGYKIVDKVILISPKQIIAEQSDKKEIKGKVVDEKGIPLPGVTILVKGASVGVSSDLDGGFVLELPKSKDIVLVVSFMGMKTQEIKIVDDKPLNIVLKEDKKQLKEVIVTGYFNRDKDSFTGSATAVTQKDLAKVGTSNIIEAIRSFDPSFKITENILNGSDPNAMPKIRVRGDSGFGVNELDAEQLMSKGKRNDPNMPIFILDGFETSIEKIYDLDKTRVKCMTLLKDAASCAIYGSRGANGIVVIETIPPEEGKLKVTYNFVGRINMPDLSDYDLCSAAEKLELERRAGLYSYPYIAEVQDNLTVAYNDKLEKVKSGINTDWAAKAVENTFSHKHSLYVEGGSRSARYGISLKYDTDKGVMKESGRDKFSLGFDFIFNKNNKLRFKNSIFIDYVKSKNSPYGNFSDYVIMNPYFSPYDENGNIVKEVGEVGFYDKDVLNPLYKAKAGSFNDNYYASIVDNFSFEYFLSDAFKIKTVLSLEGRLNKADIFISPNEARYSNYNYGDNLFKKGELFSKYNTSFRYNTFLSLHYFKTFGFHTIQFNCTGQLTQNSEDSFSTTVEGFGNNIFNHISLAGQYKITDGYDNATPGGYEEKSREISSFAAFHYVFDNRYLCDFSYTMDSSSKFGKDDRTAAFWSAGLGWNIHNEKFMEKFSDINKLKIRSNIGETGKLNFAPYQALTMFRYSNRDSYSGGIAAYLLGYGNSNLSWETTLTKDFGIDIAMFKKRLSVSGTYYIKTTNNLVTDLTVPPSTGVMSYKENVGSIENKGYEIMLRLGLVNTKDLYISAFGSLSHNRNKIIDISNALEAYNNRINALQDQKQVSEKEWPYRALTKLEYASRPMLRYTEGASMTSIYAVKSLGINPANGKEIFLRQDGTLTDVWSSTEVVVVGDTEPDAYGSCGLSANYKNWELYADFLYSVGGQMYNNTLVDKIENADPRINTDRRVFTERWSKPGDICKYKNVADNKQTKVSSRFVQDYNYLQMTSLSCSYTFYKKNLKKSGLDRLKFMLSMKDIFRLSTIKQERGINYPFAKSVAFSIQAKF